jgi:hypothetical protein
VPGGSRQANADELAHLTTYRDRGPDRAEWAVGGSTRHNSNVIGSAHDLLARGAADLHTDGGTVHAHIARFWRGDSVLAASLSASGGHQPPAMITRLHGDQAFDIEVIAGYLTDFIAQL